MDNYILKYYQSIQDGSAVVGKWIRLFYEYIIKGLESQQFIFDQKKANRAIKFIETFCHHCEGRDDLLKLETWQKSTVSIMFGIVDDAGIRIFREFLIVIGRKNGKTLFASGIIAYCLFLDGEYGAKVFCVAPKLDQADLVYQSFWQTIQKEPELEVGRLQSTSDGLRRGSQLAGGPGTETIRGYEIGPGRKKAANHSINQHIGIHQ